MNQNSMKRFIAFCLLLAVMISMLTAYASIDDHQGDRIILDEVLLQGPHPIPSDDPMYSAEFSRNCHRIQYTRIFTCACHGKASDIITKYSPHSPEWHYSSAERRDIGCCKECGQSLTRNHQHIFRKVGEYVVNAHLSVTMLRCVCGTMKSQNVYH